MGASVVMLDEFVDAPDQFADAPETATADGLLGNEAEPAFHLVEPGRIGRRVVHVETWPLGQPYTHFGVLVGGVVVDDQMHIQ